MADDLSSAHRFRYHVLPPSGPVNPLVQPGELAYYPVDAVPTGWLRADGSYYAPSDYPALFRALGYRHGKDAQNRFRVLEVVDIVEQVNPSNGDLPFNVGVDGVRSHGHPGGTLSSAGGHSHTMTVLNWYDAPYAIHYLTDPSFATNVRSGDGGINYGANGSHSHSVTASGGGGVETAPKHVILVLCVCAVGDVLETF